MYRIDRKRGEVLFQCTEIECGAFYSWKDKYIYYQSIWDDPISAEYEEGTFLQYMPTEINQPIADIMCIL